MWLPIRGDGKLNSVIKQLTSEDFCSASEIIHAENGLLVCGEYSEDNWEVEFMTELSPHSKQPNIDESEVREDEGDKDMPSKQEPMVAKSYIEAMNILKLYSIT